MAVTSSTASVCVCFPQELYPGTLQRATALFARFGDIARIDMTLGAPSGRLLVTFFDLRSAGQVLIDFGAQAEPFPAAAHDFHAVSIAASVFADLPPTFTGFQAFGEIAGVSICGEDMVVEFYDMRAAQRVSCAVPGCRPRRAAPPQSAAGDEAEAWTPAAFAAGAGVAELRPPTLLSLTESLARVELELGALTAAARGQGTCDAGERLPGPTTLGRCLPSGGKLPVAAAAAAAAVMIPTGAGTTAGAPGSPGTRAAAGKGPGAEAAGAVAATPPAATRAAGRGAGAHGGGQGGSSGKPAREKVCIRDLSKFDIVPEVLMRGGDPRTTVMVRNIPKACTREDFVSVLAACGLQERYSFFYMPFDKRRNIHCGFAFLNLKAPTDVLRLHDGVKGSLVRACPGVSPPALSYARLQGQEQLMKHFSLSAVMYDSDARKRPIFFGSGGDSSSQPQQASTMQPLYVTPLKEFSAAPGYVVGELDADIDYTVYTDSFLMSEAAGG